jgi:hypothetical protein
VKNDFIFYSKIEKSVENQKYHLIIDRKFSLF